MIEDWSLDCMELNMLYMGYLHKHKDLTILIENTSKESCSKLLKYIVERFDGATFPINCAMPEIKQMLKQLGE